VPAARTAENFALYRRYLDARHAGGGMDDPAPANFDAFLSCAWSPTDFMEFRLDGELVALAVTDVVPDALSAVYTFYAPEHAARSLGTFAILGQLRRARDEGRTHLYLGFWLDGHPKMAYKRGFRPLEYLDGAQWRPMPAA
jgi:arginyl-tRNA--protein-N-Asp/Glu arginylyltransferase